ncbi:MAG: uroporphyrinogen-III synthase [Thermaurantimonas sp.]
MKIKSILISQPDPGNEPSPFKDLAEKYKVKVDFRPFIEVKGVDITEFRKSKVNLADYPSIIFTSKNAVDHFFRIAEECRYSIPDDLKYFCVMENIAHYLQKYVVYRKRKIYFGKNSIADLLPMIKKHKDDKFLLPSSDILKPEIPTLLDGAKIQYKRAILYKTVSSDLSDLRDVTYDVLVFFSPQGIQSLYDNFPDFVQNNKKIAGFGSSTQKAILDKGLRLDIPAPTPEFPSMAMALEDFLKKSNKGK